MARLRKFAAYRTLERPYTRKSKYRTKNFVRAFPHNVIVRYVMGNTNRTFPIRLLLRSKTDCQVRSNALESARQVAVKHLETSVGKANFFLRLHKFPHHILRENPLASGAGADRLSTGMKMSFGKPIGLAAQVHTGDIIFEVRAENEAVAKRALNLVRCKLPNSWAIVAEELMEAQ